MPDCKGKCEFVRWIVTPAPYTPPTYLDACGPPQEYTQAQIEGFLKRIADNWADNNSGYQEHCKSSDCRCKDDLSKKMPAPADSPVATKDYTVTYGPWKETHTIGGKLECSYTATLKVQLSKYRWSCDCVEKEADYHGDTPHSPTGRECLGQCTFSRWWVKGNPKIDIKKDAGCWDPSDQTKKRVEFEALLEGQAIARSLSKAGSGCDAGSCDCSDNLADKVPGPGDVPVGQTTKPLTSKKVEEVRPVGGSEQTVTCHYWGQGTVDLDEYLFTAECMPKNLH